MKLTLIRKFKSLTPFSIDLPDFVILTGINGAGKTQLLNAMQQMTLSVSVNNVELNPKKYVTSQTLSPNEGTIVTRQKLNESIEIFWQRFNNYVKAKQHNPNIQAQDYLGNPLEPQIKIIDTVIKRANKKLEKLNLDDFFNHYPLEDGLSQTDVFYQNFSSLFKRYQDRLDDNEFRQFRNEVKGYKEITFLPKKEFVKVYGEAPWDFVNKIIKEANLDYHINSPVNNHRDAPFELKLINSHNGAEIKFEDLSSGEKVLMSLALALYNSNLDIEFPKVLLMDEPDASLHPSMSKKFLDVIQQVFVKQKGVKVIITTHSPSTVALAPEESIFIVNKIEPRIEKASKDKALKILTSGVPSFSVNYENRRQVFVESPNDVIYYETLYKQLSNRLIPEISLTFISSGESRTDKNGIKISNCDQVINIAETLRKSGNKFVSGIVDWDTKNKNTEAVKVLGNGNRYSIENYILDPLLIAALLLREKIVAKEKLNMNLQETFVDLKYFNKEKLQFIVDYITHQIEAVIEPTDKTTIPSKLINGVEINIPKWYLHYQGHSLEEQILKVYPKLGEIKKGKEDALKVEILNKIVDDLTEILSIDILNVLESVQNHD